NVDGTFVAVGGAGLIPFLKAYEQAHGPIDGKKFIGNLFWGTPGEFQQLGTRVAGAYVGGAGTAGDLNTAAAKAYNAQVGKVFKTIPPFGAAAPQASSTFTYGYYINTWGLLAGLKAVGGSISGGQKALQSAIGKVKLSTPYGPLRLDKNRQAVINVFYGQLYTKDGKLATKTVGEIPGDVEPTSGTIEFLGAEISALPARTRAKLGMGRTYQKSRSFNGMSVEDNLYLAVLGVRSGHYRFYETPGRRRELRAQARELAEIVGLGGKCDDLVGALSHGEQRQLE